MLSRKQGGTSVPHRQPRSDPIDRSIDQSIPLHWNARVSRAGGVIRVISNLHLTVGTPARKRDMALALARAALAQPAPISQSRIVRKPITLERGRVGRPSRPTRARRRCRDGSAGRRRRRAGTLVQVPSTEHAVQDDGVQGDVYVPEGPRNHDQNLPGAGDAMRRDASVGIPCDGRQARVQRRRVEWSRLLIMSTFLKICRWYSLAECSTAVQHTQHAQHAVHSS